MRFADREEAGRQLAHALAHYADGDTIVYALPRGGVALGAIIAKLLRVPLDLIIVRKIGHPANREYALCAITESGEMVCNEEERALIDAAWLAREIETAKGEVARRRREYLRGRQSVDAAGRTAIVVDDGIATGLTMLAALRAVRAQGPRRLVVAVPVIPRDTADRLAAEADEVVALDIPTLFLGAVGAYYDDFHQLTDTDVSRLLHQGSALLYAQPDYATLAERLLAVPGLFPGDMTEGRFPNGEHFLRLDTPARGHRCAALLAIAPPDDRLVGALLLCHTLRGAGAARVTAYIPYLAYMRQDRQTAGHGMTTTWIGDLLAATGVNEVVTIDIHGALALGALPMPVRSLSPAPLYAAQLGRLGLTDITLIAPDEGARERRDAVRQALGVEVPVAHFVKQRDTAGVRVTLRGEVSGHVVLIDDILDTGATLLACCAHLRQAGIREMTIMVTHGLFTGDAWRQLWEYGVTAIYHTDTVPVPAAARDARLHVLPIAPLLVPALAGET